MNAFTSLELPQRRSLLVLFCSGLFFWLSMTCMLPVLSSYIEDAGGTKQQVGLVMGCFAIGLLASRNWLGNLADGHSRKIVVLIGAAVAAIAAVGYLFVDSILLLALMRAFHGISIAGFTTGYMALVVDISPAKQRGELIGYMSLCIPIGMTIGPALGGFLADYGYNYLFLSSAAEGILAFILALLVKETSRKEINARVNLLKLEPNRDFWELFKSHSLFVPGVVLLLIGLLFGTLATYLPLFVRETDLKFNAGLYYSAAAIASFVVRVFVGKASDSIGRGLFITGSLAFYALSMVFLAIAEDGTTFLMSAIFEGIGAGILIPTIQALMSDRSYTNERGKVYAICNSGFDLGVALAGPILGVLAAFLSYRIMFLLTSVLAILALFIFITQSSKGLGHSFRFAFGKEKDAYALDL
ncbi:MAG: MFS transporter [Xenococcaceae cyanobacterium]